jgi:circadian clock protein KaiB
MSRPSIFKFRLYIAGGTQNSALATANLNTLCRIHLPDRYDIEIVDVLREPKRALKDQIYMTPTLVKLMPSPTQRIVGTLNQAPFVLQALGVEPLPS